MRHRTPVHRKRPALRPSAAPWQPGSPRPHRALPRKSCAEVCHRLIARARLKGACALNHRAQALGQPCNARTKLPGRVALGQRPGCRVRNHTAHGIQVRPRIHHREPMLLGRRKVPCSLRILLAIVLKRRHARAPEVDKMRPVFYQYDVGGRDVPVHRAVRMQVGKRLAQIDR